MARGNRIKLYTNVLADRIATRMDESWAIFGRSIGAAVVRRKRSRAVRCKWACCRGSADTGRRTAWLARDPSWPTTRPRDDWTMTSLR